MRGNQLEEHTLSTERNSKSLTTLTVTLRLTSLAM